MRGLRPRLVARLTSARAPWVALALALALLLPTLGDGLRMDDRWLRTMVLGDPQFPGMARAPHRLFSFFDGAETLAILRARGVTPWYTVDDLRLSFFRPLASLLHAAEFRLLGSATWAMHAVSLALYAALVVAAHGLLVRLLARTGDRDGLGIARLGTALYALDPNHGLAAGWLAQRNSLFAALFGVLALHAHDRAVRDGERRMRLAAPALVLLALWSAEAGTSCLLALVAHALTLTPRGRRAASLAPYLAPLALWAAGYVAGEYGVRGTGMYLDLLREPIRAVGSGLVHLPVLLSLELGHPPADFWTLATTPGRVAIVGFALLLVVGFGSGVAGRVRASREARFLALAGLLATLPGCGTQPMGRLLLFSGVFLMPLVAGVLLDALAGTLAPSRGTRWLARAVAVHVGILRLVLAPPLLANSARSMVLFENAFGTFAASLPEDHDGDGIALVVNAPDLGFFGYLRLLADRMGQRPPETFALASGTRLVTLRGLDRHTFALRCEGGFVRTATDQLSRSEGMALRLGESFVSGPLTFTVSHLDAAGRADEAQVRSTLPLDDRRLKWLAWQGDRLVSVRPPLGPEAISFPAQSFLGHLLATARAPRVHVPGG